MQVGGAARYFAEAGSAGEVRESGRVRQLRESSRSVGTRGGSNVIVSDQGWPGLVLKVAIAGSTIAMDTALHTSMWGAGEDWDGFVAMAVKHNCSGVECLSGIPGSVGGTTGTERGRLRAGSGGDDRFAGGARCRDRGRARVRG